MNFEGTNEGLNIRENYTFVILEEYMVGSLLKGRESSCVVNGGLNYGPRERVMLKTYIAMRLTTASFDDNGDHQA